MERDKEEMIALFVVTIVYSVIGYQCLLLYKFKNEQQLVVLAIFYHRITSFYKRLKIICHNVRGNKGLLGNRLFGLRKSIQQLLSLLVKMENLPAASSNIEETYCIPLRDIRLGFRTPKLHLQSDRQNILITLFQHPKIIKLQQILQGISRAKQSLKSQSTQTPISTVLQKFIFQSEIQVLEMEGKSNQGAKSQLSQKRQQIKYSNYCNTSIQTMLTGKNMDSLDQSTNNYIKSLENKINEGQIPSPFRKKKQCIKQIGSSPITSGFELISSCPQGNQVVLKDFQIIGLQKEIEVLKSALEASLRDNIQLTQAKGEWQRRIVTQHQRITQLHSEISKLTLQNSRLKTKDLTQSKASGDQPVRQRASPSQSKKGLEQVKLAELQTLQEENRVLRHYIETIKAQSPIRLIKQDSIKKQQPLSNDKQETARNRQLIQKLQSQNKTLQQRYSSAHTKIRQLQQMKSIIFEMDQKQPTSRFQKQIQTQKIIKVSSLFNTNLQNQNQDLQSQNRRLQQKVIFLTREIHSEKQYSNLLKGQNQSLVMDMKKTTVFGEEEYTKLNYKRLVEMHEEQSKELKNAEVVISGLKQIIREYQQVLDQREEQEESVDEQDTDILNYFSQAINNQLAYLNDIIVTHHPSNQRSEDMNFQMDKLVHEFKKEYNKRILLENKLERLSHTLMEYQQEILEKTARISDLNYTILQMQEQSEMSMSFSQDFSSHYQGSPHKFQYEYKTAKDFRKTKYDQPPIEHNASEEDTITESRIRDQMEQSQRGIKPSKLSKTSQRQQESLRTIISKNHFSSSKQRLSLILQIVECLEKNISIWRFELTPSNIIVRSKRKEIRLDTSKKNESDPLYASPEQLYQAKSENSTVWRLGIIFDELIHGSLFFESMQQIADSKILYKFRSRETEWEPIKKLLGKALIKNNSLRINMLKLLSGIRAEVKSKHE